MPSPILNAPQALIVNLSYEFDMKGFRVLHIRGQGFHTGHDQACRSRPQECRRLALHVAAVMGTQDESVFGILRVVSDDSNPYTIPDNPLTLNPELQTSEQESSALILPKPQNKVSWAFQPESRILGFLLCLVACGKSPRSSGSPSRLVAIFTRIQDPPPCCWHFSFQRRWTPSSLNCELGKNFEGANEGLLYCSVCTCTRRWGSVIQTSHALFAPATLLRRIVIANTPRTKSMRGAPPTLARTNFSSEFLRGQCLSCGVGSACRWDGPCIPPPSIMPGTVNDNSGVV